MYFETSMVKMYFVTSMVKMYFDTSMVKMYFTMNNEHGTYVFYYTYGKH
jgi:hypothetical protein